MQMPEVMVYLTTNKLNNLNIFHHQNIFKAAIAPVLQA